MASVGKKIKILVAFSGGKDSLAALLWTIKESGFKKESIEAVFCDTNWEHEVTYQHIKEVVEKLDVKLVTVKSKKYAGLVDLAAKKKRFPSTKARFCTEELKTKPMIDYILDECNCHVLVVQGIRADESRSRALMKKQCTYFRYYYEPYQSNSMIVAQWENRSDLTATQKKKLETAKARLAKGKEDFKYHTYRKKEVMEFRKNYSDDVVRPCFEWTGVEVMNYILDAGMKPNPLYYQDAKRVGCFPCIMCSKGELKAMIEHNPKYIERLKEAEKTVGRTFFPPNYIPKHYMSRIDEKTGKKMPTIENVIRYVTDKNSNLDLFEDEKKNDERKCMSFYGICE